MTRPEIGDVLAAVNAKCAVLLVLGRLAIARRKARAHRAADAYFGPTRVTPVRSSSQAPSTTARMAATPAAIRSSLAA